jgi:putative flippase GtrA
VVDSPRSGLFDRIRGVVDIFWREVAKFGVIGAVGFIIDFGGFTLLFYGPLAGHLTTAKIISGVAATTFAWVGNRMWTFRHRRNRPAHHEALLFFAVNGVGLVISTVWLNFSHDVLGYTSRSAVSLNTIIGIGLATIFRFWAYRQFVFAGEHVGDPEDVVVPVAGPVVESAPVDGRDVPTPPSPASDEQTPRAS